MDEMSYEERQGGRETFFFRISILKLRSSLLPLYKPKHTHGMKWVVHLLQLLHTSICRISRSFVKLSILG